MVFLGDFSKAASDLYKKKKFNFFRTMEVKADSSNVLSWSAKNTIDAKGKTTSEVVFNEKEKGLGEMKCTFKSPDTMEIEAKSKDTPLSELKVKFAQDVIEVAGTYDEKDNAWAAKMKVVSKSDYSCTSDFSFDVTDEWSVAANAVVTDSGLKDYGVGLRYMSGKKQHFSLTATNQLNNLCIAGSLKSTDYFGQIGAQIDIAKLQSENPVPTVTAGGLITLEERAKLRWRLDLAKQNLGLAYEYKFAPNFSGSFASSVGTDFKMAPLGMKFDVSL